MKHSLRRAALALLFPATALSAAAQWSSDPAVNLAIADAASDQILPKVAPTADGGCYVSWFDGIATGFDVRLQRLDANGVEQWPHNGILVADRGFSSVQDYGLDVDAVGAAVLAFRDDTFSPVQVTAQRVTSGGVLVWGASGVQVAPTPGSVTSPKVAGVASGDVVVTWGDSGSTHVMRLLPNGGTAWPAPIVLTPGAGFYSPSDLHDSGEDVLLSIVHQTGPAFFDPKHLLAQKLDSSGAPLWGAQPVSVFDGGSLQIGNFPSFVPDGSGGAVFSWYGTSPLQCYAQRVLANGTEAFPHNGSAGSTNLTNTRVSPSAAFDAATSSTYMFWEEQNGGQSLSGLSGQRFDAAGGRQWGATGKELIAIGTTEINWVRTLTTAAGAYVFWIAIPSFGNGTGHGAIVDGNGDFSVSPLAFASTPSGKSRLAAARSALGDAILAWSDDRSDGGDVLAQNFRSDGTLGLGGPTVYCTAKLSSAGCTNDVSTAGPQASPTSLANDYQVTCTNVQGVKNGLVFAGISGPAALPFSGGILCVSPPLKRGPIMNSTGSSPTACDGSYATTINDALIPGGLDPGAGNTGWYQYWYRDPDNGAGNLGTALSTAVEIDFL